MITVITVLLQAILSSNRASELSLLLFQGNWSQGFESIGSRSSFFSRHGSETDRVSLGSARWLKSLCHTNESDRLRSSRASANMCEDQLQFETMEDQTTHNPTLEHQGTVLESVSAPKILGFAV